MSYQLNLNPSDTLEIVNHHGQVLGHLDHVIAASVSDGHLHVCRRDTLHSQLRYRFQIDGTLDIKAKPQGEGIKWSVTPLSNGRRIFP